MQIKQNSATLALVFFMADSSDHVTGKTGLSPTVTLSKNGGTFASPAGAVSEIGEGFYKVAANAADTNTLGILALSATATGADQAAMAFEVVANIESDSIAAIGSLNNLSAAGVRSELATELARIDVAVSTRNATTPPTTAQIRTELATELARIDVAISTRNATTPPTVAAIADAVWDEAISGHATAGTTGAQLAAAGAAGDPWSTVIPADYADGTAGAAIGRLNNTPAEAPIIVVPAPDPDGDLTVCYIYTEDITNVARAGIVLTFVLVSTPAKSERVLETASKTATTDSDGYAQISLQSGLRYRVTCSALGLEKTFTPSGETYDLKTLIP